MELKFKVLIIGGGYGGLGALTNLLDLVNAKRPRFDFSDEPLASENRIPVDITLVDERDGYMHLIGNPLALADRKYASKVWQRYAEIPGLRTAPNLQIIQGTVTSLSPDTRTAVIAKSAIPGTPAATFTQFYDYCIVATGLRRVWPTVPRALTKDAYLAEAYAHLDRVDSVSARQHGVAVIGGGAVGIEMAAELKHIDHDVPVTLIHSRARLLSVEPLPDEFAQTTERLLEKMGVLLKLGVRVLKTVKISEEPNELWEIHLSTGEVAKAAVVITAISGQHPTGVEFLPREAVDEKGYVHIESNLSIKNVADGHFCVGDAVKWSGIKRAGAAMWMGSLAARNIHQRMLVERGGKKREEIKDRVIEPIPPMMALAVGNEAVGYGAEGVTFGEEVGKMMFGDDLGWSICWNYMKLGDNFNEF